MADAPERPDVTSSGRQLDPLPSVQHFPPSPQLHNVHRHRRSRRQFVPFPPLPLPNTHPLTAPPAVSRLETASPQGTTLTISNCGSILTDAHLGDSISVNGTCLTITHFSTDEFRVGVAPETLRRTNLARLRAGDGVNLERAVCAATRLGGHFVQGHVDAVAEVAGRRADGEAVVFRLRPRGEEGRRALRGVVEKGYVALDGASLTVTAVDDGEGWFEVMLVAYTQEKVGMMAKGVGDDVNVEVDMVGKYVEKSVRGYFEGAETEGGAVLEKLVARIVDEKMKRP